MSLLRLFKLSEKEMQEVCAAYVQQILSVSEPVAIYMFGSMARGSASIESDIDLLAVYEDRPAAKAAQRAVFRQRSPCPVSADLFFIDIDSWTSNRPYSPLIDEVRSAGRLVYESVKKLDKKI
jgi:hypothetical protein